MKVFVRGQFPDSKAKTWGTALRLLGHQISDLNVRGTDIAIFVIMDPRDNK